MKVGIIGGSLGGLQTGIELLNIGLDVHIFERSNHELRDRGAGIILQKRVIDHLHFRKLAEIGDIGVFANRRSFYSLDCEPVFIPATVYATSWKNIFNCYRKAIPDNRYHINSECTSFRNMGDRVRIVFKNGKAQDFDFVVFADGGASSARQKLQPDVHQSYSGHIAWRGLVAEKDASSVLDKFESQITIFHGKHTHILCYLVPGNNLSNKVGERFLNWVWYRRFPENDFPLIMTDKHGTLREFSVPQGLIKPDLIETLRNDAEKELIEPFAQLVGLTEQPFLQPIFDLTPEQVAFDRMVLLGDAGYLARPHATASTYKSLVEAESLGQCLRESSNLSDALLVWEQERKTFSAEIVKKSKEMGNLDRYIKPQSSSV